MKRTRTRPKPRPGAAKLGVDLDKRIGEKSEALSERLVNDFLAGSPTAQNIISSWAQDAEFAQKCITVHGKTLSQLIDEAEKEMAEDARERSQEQLAVSAAA